MFVMHVSALPLSTFSSSAKVIFFEFRGTDQILSLRVSNMPHFLSFSLHPSLSNPLFLFTLVLQVWMSYFQ